MLNEGSLTGNGDHMGLLARFSVEKDMGKVRNRINYLSVIDISNYTNHSNRNQYISFISAP